MTYIPKIHVCYVGLELSLQLDFLDSVVREDKDPLKELYGGKIAPRKVKINISSLRQYLRIFRPGFSANETFREKMQKFSFAFRKLFREILDFFAKMTEAKKCKNIAKFREFCFTLSAIIFLLNFFFSRKPQESPVTITRKNLLNRPYFFAEFSCFFSHYFPFFRKTYAIFFCIFSRNFCIYYFAKISQFFKKQIDVNGEILRKKRKIQHFL